jgi:hypothetical protein
MGLTVYYQGSIKSPDLLPELIEEVQDIANTFENEERREGESWEDFFGRITGK